MSSIAQQGNYIDDGIRQIYCGKMTIRVQVESGDIFTCIVPVNVRASDIKILMKSYIKAFNSIDICDMVLCLQSGARLSGIVSLYEMREEIFYLEIIDWDSERECEKADVILLLLSYLALTESYLNNALNLSRCQRRTMCSDLGNSEKGVFMTLLSLNVYRDRLWGVCDA